MNRLHVRPTDSVESSTVVDLPAELEALGQAVCATMSEENKVLGRLQRSILEYAKDATGVFAGAAQVDLSQHVMGRNSLDPRGKQTPMVQVAEGGSGGSSASEADKSPVERAQEAAVEAFTRSLQDAVNTQADLRQAMVSQVQVTTAALARALANELNQDDRSESESHGG